MKAVIHKTGAIGEVLWIERRDDGIDYVYFESGLCKPISEVGFLNPYEQYMEDWSDLEDFRREAAKDILAGMVANKVFHAHPDDDDEDYLKDQQRAAKRAAFTAIVYVDALIQILKQE